MTLPLGPKADLAHLLEKLPEHATAAKARLLGIQAYIEALEAELDLIRAQRRLAGLARAEALGPKRCREIAIQAGKRQKTATGTDPLPLNDSSNV